MYFRLLPALQTVCALALSAALLLLAHPTRGEDDAAEALESINRQLQSNPTDTRLLQRRSHVWIFLRKYDQALADLNQANRLSPLPELEREQAQIYLAAGWFETGLEHADRYLRQFPDDSEGYLVRGRLNARLDRRAEAGADLGAAIDHSRNPGMELYLERAQVLTTDDGAHLPDVLATLDQAIKRFGPIVTLESAALEAELRGQRYDDALSRLDQIISTAPRKDTWMARRGDVLSQAGRENDARSAYQDALNAIEKLTPAQRSQPATKELETQLRNLLQTSGSLAGHSAVPGTRLLASKPSEDSTVEYAPSSTNPPAMPPGGKVRTYYIAAEEVEWDYMPSGNVLQEPFCGDPDARAGKMPGRIGSRYKKALYREYTDQTFQRLQLRSADWRHLGLLGPLLRAEVGDRIRVIFKNKTRFPVSMHPHGVFYLKTAEGSGYNDMTRPADKKDDGVHAGETFTYEWFVPERAGPGPNDPSSLVWLYHSHIHAGRDGNAGLMGAIIVTAKGKARPDGSPTDVDREFVTLFNVFDENQSWYLDLNLKTYLGSTTNSALVKDPLFKASNLKHAINGYLFGNLPLLTMAKNERVRWYLTALGSEADLHTPHWHGNSVLCQGRRTDVVELLPASMKVADMLPDNPGIWMFHCHVNDHMVEGMSARFEVREKWSPSEAAQLKTPR